MLAVEGRSIALHADGYSGKAQGAEIALSPIVDNENITVTNKENTGETGVPNQPWRRKHLRTGARNRALNTAKRLLVSGEPVTSSTVIAGAECGNIFDAKRFGFYTRTEVAVVTFDDQLKPHAATGSAGGVRVPMRYVLSSLFSRGKLTVGEAMSRQLGGDPQDPHAMLGQGSRVDQITHAHRNAFEKLKPTLLFSGNKAR